MNDHKLKPSQPTDDTNFVERTISRASAKDDKSLALVALTMWASECIKHGVEIVGDVVGTFKLTPKGKGKDAHMVCTGKLGNGPDVGVRVRPTDD